MTKQQLDAVRARVEAAPKVGDTYIDENGDEVRIVETVEDADFCALLAEVDRLRDVLAAVAAPLSPSAHDLWAGVDMARRALGGKR